MSERVFRLSTDYPRLWALLHDGATVVYQVEYLPRNGGTDLIDHIPMSIRDTDEDGLKVWNDISLESFGTGNYLKSRSKFAMIWLALVAVWAWFSLTTDLPLFTFFVVPFLSILCVIAAVVTTIVNMFGLTLSESDYFLVESEDRFYGDSE